MSRRLIRNTPTKNSATGIWSLRDVIQFKTVDLWPDASTYALSRLAAFVFEGSSQTITLTTENVPNGSLIPYIVTGITQDDLSAGFVSGDFVVNNNTASVSFTFVDNGEIEIEEIATLSLPTVIPATSITWKVYDLVIGQQAYTTPGTYTFIVPPGVVFISALVIGGGGSGASAGRNRGGQGGGGAGLTYGNNISVTPGESLTVVVGAGGAAVSGGNTVQTAGRSGQISTISRGSTVLIRANNGPNGNPATSSSYTSAGGIGRLGTSWTGGGNGGRGYALFPGSTTSTGGGGGGAGGYLGNGADAGTFPAAGSGAGGGGLNWPNAFIGNARGGNGGGVGIYGSGYTSATRSGNNAASGSGGISTNVTQIRYDVNYGGGSGGAGSTSLSSWLSLPGGGGAARIIWGPNRAYPSTNTGDL